MYVEYFPIMEPKPGVKNQGVAMMKVEDARRRCMK